MNFVHLERIDTGKRAYDQGSGAAQAPLTGEAQGALKNRL